MPSSTRKRFELLTDPEPLPDADDPQASSPPAAEEPDAPQAEASRPEPEAPKAVSRPQPPPAPAAAPGGRAATTVRLRPAAAELLQAAWLEARRTDDPKLSYPQFASHIVSLGLAAHQRRKAKP